MFTGHTSNIKKCLLSPDSKYIFSISDDKTLRLWDINTNMQLKCIKFDNIPNSIELSEDGELLILAQGNLVQLFDTKELNMLQSFNIPAAVSAVSIHPNKSVFVCGGDNFTLYKYSIQNGTELGSCFFYNLYL